jgi:hypothetical protein
VEAREHEPGHAAFTRIPSGRDRKDKGTVHMPVISPNPFHYWRSLPHRPERVERRMSRSIIRTL